MIWEEYNDVNITYYENTEALALSTSIVPSGTDFFGNDKANLYKWCDVPGVQVRINISFTTGAAYYIAEKNVYHGYKPPLSQNITDYYSFSVAEDSQFLLKPVCNEVKIKSATAYTQLGKTSNSIVYWDNRYVAVQCITQNDVGSIFDPALYEYVDGTKDEIIKLELETLDGRTFTVEKEANEEYFDM